MGINIFKRKPKKIRIKLVFEIVTKKIRIELTPKNTKPTFAVELLGEGMRIIERSLAQEIEQKLSEDKKKKVDYIA